MDTEIKQVENTQFQPFDVDNAEKWFRTVSNATMIIPTKLKSNHEAVVDARLLTKVINAVYVLVLDGKVPLEILKGIIPFEEDNATGSIDDKLDKILEEIVALRGSASIN
jgi:hypothetical protein